MTKYVQNNVAAVAELGTDGVVTIRAPRETDDADAVFTDATKLWAAMQRWAKPVSCYSLALAKQDGNEKPDYMPAAITREQGGKLVEVAHAAAAIADWEPTRVYLSERWGRTRQGKPFKKVILTAWIKTGQVASAGGKIVLRDETQPTKPAILK